jgi:hypothetical protein
MLKIMHHINTIDKLHDTPVDYGVAIDVYAGGNRIFVADSPFDPGTALVDWLKAFRHRFLVVCIRVEGIEEQVLGFLAQYGVLDFFFLDLAVPRMVEQVRSGVRQVAVRVSEYEPVEMAERFAGLVDWVTVDCFNSLPLTTAMYQLLSPNFRVCLISPELRGHPLERIPEFARQVKDMDIAEVLTEHPRKWQDEQGSP